MKLQTTDEWVEDYGYCIFFHFEAFDEPPTISCDTPLSIDFEEGYWTHFSADFDFNEAIKQAAKLDSDAAQEFMAN